MRSRVADDFCSTCWERPGCSEGGGASPRPILGQGSWWALPPTSFPGYLLHVPFSSPAPSSPPLSPLHLAKSPLWGSPSSHLSLLIPPPLPNSTHLWPPLSLPFFPPLCLLLLFFSVLPSPLPTGSSSIFASSTLRLLPVLISLRAKFLFAVLRERNKNNISSALPCARNRS